MEMGHFSSQDISFSTQALEMEEGDENQRKAEDKGGEGEHKQGGENKEGEGENDGENVMASFVQQNLYEISKKTINVTQFTYFLWDLNVLNPEEFKITLAVNYSDFVRSCQVYELLTRKKCQRELVEALKMSGNFEVATLLKNFLEKNTSHLHFVQEGLKAIDLDVQNQNEWFQVKDPVQSFVGRVQFLESLHQACQLDDVDSPRSPGAGTSGVTIRSRIQVICGLSGSGKTEVCRKYARSYGSAYDNVIWIKGGSLQNAQNSMWRLAQALKLNSDCQTIESEAALLQKIYRHLCAQKRSLLIFDNFDLNHDLDLYQPDRGYAYNYESANVPPVSVHQFLPSSLPPTFTLPTIFVTSRAFSPDLNCHKLGNLTLEESKLFILNGLQSDQPQNQNSGQGQGQGQGQGSMSEYQKWKNEMDAMVLAKVLGGLPVALQRAVDFIKSQNLIQNLVGGESYTIESYLSEFAQNPQDILNLNCDLGPSKPSLLSMWDSTLALIYTQVSNSIPFNKNDKNNVNLRGVMVTPGQVLNFVVFLIPVLNSPDFEPIGIRSDLFVQFMGQYFVECEPEQIARALETLATYFLIEVHNRVISMNRFVQMVLRERLVARQEILPVLDQVVATWIKFLPQQQSQDHTTIKSIPGNWKKRLISLSRFLDKYWDGVGERWPNYLPTIVGPIYLRSIANGSSLGGKYEEILTSFFGKI